MRHKISEARLDPLYLDPLYLDEAHHALATDLYQLTMMAAYWQRGMEEEATFELFVRRLQGRSFLVAAGLEQALAYLHELRFDGEDIDWLRGHPVFGHVPAGFFEWLRGYRFSGSVDAVPEGSVVFANEPLLRVTAPLPEAQLVETFLLATINCQTMLASKAARVRLACEGRRAIDFGSRRAHGMQAALYAARAAWVAGFDGTSNVLAGQRLGIPVTGTAAHAYIMAFAREEEAFAHYHSLYPDHCILLIDTYDTPRGCRRATAVGEDLRGVRLDSGDLGALAFECRAILDEAGLKETKIVASGDLNEHKIAKLLADGAPIDSFGVGTELVTSRDEPTLSGVYKLVELRRKGERAFVMKKAEGKVSWPAKKQVFRVYGADGRIARDVLDRLEAEPPEAPAGGRVEALLRPVMKEGALIDSAEAREAYDLGAARARCAEALLSLPEAQRGLGEPVALRAEIGPGLASLAEEISSLSL